MGRPSRNCKATKSRGPAPTGSFQPTSGSLSPERYRENRTGGAGKSECRCTPRRGAMTKFVDTEELSAWSTGHGMIRIQTRVPEIVEAISRLKDTWRIGESEKGSYLRLFHTTQPQRKVLSGILTRILPQGVPSQEPRRSRGTPSRYGDSGRRQSPGSRILLRKTLPRRSCATEAAPCAASSTQLAQRIAQKGER